MYRDTTASFPDDKMVLGRDLGPAIDVGPAMTHKVLKSNGQTIYRSTVRALTDDKMSDEDMKRQRQVFDSNVRSFLGAAITPKEMASDPNMVCRSMRTRLRSNYTKMTMMVRKTTYQTSMTLTQTRTTNT